MRLITLHCDYIKFKPVKKALKSAQDLNEEEKKEKEIKDPLVVLTAVEQGDNDQTVKEYIEAIKKTAGEVKAKNLVLYPYAHLSSNLSNPDTAKEYMVEAESVLKKQGFSVTRAPFGYYKEFELKCKGHPLSELSKEFGPLHENKDKSQVIQEAKDKAKGKTEEKQGTEDISQLLNQISRSKLDTSKLKDNDHRILAQRLDLFSFNEASPGSVFWHPNGQMIFNSLVDFSRALQSEKGYKEVSTPQIFSNKLWKVSGHWDHYKDNMFLTDYEGKQSGIKPMNCPGHMLLYKASTKSYKDLPLRMSEYGALHRMELSGVLNGLFRVIRLHQDDTHIFCTLDQLESEISGILDLIKVIYTDTFKFKKIEVKLSTRPDKFMGDKSDWDKTEEALEKVLKKTKMKYEIKKGEGAFYGPKIDFDIEDSLNRKWQCSTIQLDMQLPKKFELEYTGEDNKKHTPLVIHRAVFGSLERFIGILLEHTNGNLPFWLSPVQARIINFTDRNTKAAEKILEKIKKEIPQLRIDCDFRNTTVNDKVRDSSMMKISFTIVIGEKEEKNNTLAIRTRDGKVKYGVKLDKFIKEIKD